MEQALLISSTRDIEAAVSGGCTRVYFGSEFCERLLPSPQELQRTAGTARDRGLALTLVTPFLTDEGMRRALRLLDTAAALSGTACEIVFNDWGLLRVIEERYAGRFAPVLGRLLSRQKGDPRIAGLETLTSAAEEHYRSVIADTRVLAEFLSVKGVGRVELNNVPQGIERPPGSIRASLHVPYACVTATRMCLIANASGGKTRCFRTIGPCRRECGEYTLRLSHADMPRDLLVRGNAVFVENPDLPPDPERLNIDRIVHQ